MLVRKETAASAALDVARSSGEEDWGGIGGFVLRGGVFFSFFFGKGG